MLVPLVGRTRWAWSVVRVGAMQLLAQAAWRSSVARVAQRAAAGALVARPAVRGDRPATLAWAAQVA